MPTSSEFRVLKDYFVAEGYPALIGDPHDLEYDGDYSSVDGFRIDNVYKRESSFTNFLAGLVETIRWSMHIIHAKLAHKNLAYLDRVYLDQLFIDFNPFLFSERSRGRLIRLSASSLLNVSSGAGQTALLVSEELDASARTDTTVMKESSYGRAIKRRQN